MGSTTYPEGGIGVVDLGHRHFAMRSNDGLWLWWHDCSRKPISWQWFGQAYDGSRGTGHVVKSESPLLTVEGSLLCTFCQDHGHIRDGKWIKA